MTFKNDNFSADSLASAMDEVMQSSEHKDMFKKEAQVNMGFSAMPGANTSQTSTSMPSGAGTMNVMDPSGKPASSIKSTVDPTAPIKSTTPVGDVQGKLQAIVENPSLAGIHGDEAAALAGKILAGTASPSELSMSNPAMTNLMAGGFSASKESQDGVLAVLKEFNSKPKSSVASDNIVEQLVKIANYLGENQMLQSEAVADALIETIIVEAKKKVEKKKDADKKEKKAAKKLKKLEKKMKKDMPDECKKCKCDPCECE